MIPQSLSQLPVIVSDYFWPFCRILALISSAPLLGDKQVNSRVKIGLALAISALLTPLLPSSGIALFSPQGIITLCSQLIIGIGLGWGMTLAFSAVRLAGEVAGLQMGLSFASFYDPSSHSSVSVLARIFYTLALLLFLSVDGHLWLLKILADTFTALPVSQSGWQPAFFSGLCQAAGIIFSSALRLALPLIMLLLALNMTLGLVNRMSPQLSVFVVGFPLTLSIGILSSRLLFPWFMPYTRQIFSRLLEQLATLLLQ